jgi:hypothetical protein
MVASGDKTMKPTFIACATWLAAGFPLAMACSGGTANVEFISHDKNDAGVDAASSGGSGGAGTSGGTAVGAGGTGGGRDCPNDSQCAPNPQQSWYLVWFWTGPASAEPPCPSYAPSVGVRAYADLVAPHNCDACGCEASTGSCKLPSQITGRIDPICMAGPDDIPFDAPDPWDGSCTDLNAVPAQSDCANNPCIKSVTAETMTVVGEQCAPSAIPEPAGLPPPTWQTVGLGCYAEDPPPKCNGKAGKCVPKADPPDPQWRLCTWRDDGDVQFDCLAPYEDRYIFYRSVDDQRKCSPCQCGAPQGSICSADLWIYEDGACSMPKALFGINSSFPGCATQYPPGVALGSKKAIDIQYTSGTCEPSGGQPEGEATPFYAVTVCCLKSPSP